jgi:hypothetical protein
LSSPTGGRLFDPIGFSRGSEEMYKKYKQNEIVNGRLAMVANLGFWAQYAATGKGPIQNLADHLADPYHTTFTTNGKCSFTKALMLLCLFYWSACMPEHFRLTHTAPSPCTHHHR